MFLQTRFLAHHFVMTSFIIALFPPEHIGLLSVGTVSSICKFALVDCHSHSKADSCSPGTRTPPESLHSRRCSSPKQQRLDARMYPRRCTRPPKALQFTLLMAGLWFGMFIPTEIMQVPIIFALVSPIPIYGSKSEICERETKAQEQLSIPCQISERGKDIRKLYIGKH